MSVFQPGAIRDELTRQLSHRGNPLRAFLEERFAGQAMFEMERDAPFQRKQPWLIVPPGDSDPALMRDAAQWLLHTLTTPRLDLANVYAGACACRAAGLHIHDADVTALAELCAPHADPRTLARACWALAVLAHVRDMDRPTLRRSVAAVLPDEVTRDGLLNLASTDAIVQLAMFHHIYLTRLIPELGQRHLAAPDGCPRLAGAKFVDTQPALLAGGLLLEVTATAKWAPFRRVEVYRLIAGVLLDFDDEFGIDMVAVFNVRYADLQMWRLSALLDRLAGEPVDLCVLRGGFRGLLAAGC